MHTPSVVEHPFQIRGRGQGRVSRWALGLTGPMIERALGFGALNDIYHAAQRGVPEREFCERVLDVMDAPFAVDEKEWSRIPKSGPLVVVANHPFGGLDGVALIALLRRIRPDVKVLANFLLSCIPELRESFFFVNPFGAPESSARDLGAIRGAIEWVQQGGVLGVFPAGEVAHRTWRNSCITDPSWNPAAARIIQRTEATVLPVFFYGRNSTRFQYAGLVHPRLRTALLPRELANKRHQKVRVRIGTPIPFRRIRHFTDAKVLSDYLRLRTFILRGGHGDGTATNGGSESSEAPVSHDRVPVVVPTPIVSPTPLEQIRADLTGLPAEALLMESGPFAVCVARAVEAPAVMREIGRLREITFRAVGEGTGREIDLDRFDEHYLHLFIWNREREHLVGAYRLGATDEISRQQGTLGLYTSTLFEFDAPLIAQISPALELGRSFVVGEYQKNHLPLMLLWRGIGRYVARNPRYRMLFGAVSISDEFQSMTKQILMSFLDANRYRSELADWVHPKNPPQRRAYGDFPDSLVSAVVRDLDEVDELVAEIEENHRTMPVLLRQYLKLNARLLGFNIDPDFGDVLDGLVLIDLLQVDRPVLDRYLGKEEAEGFRRFHSQTCNRSNAKSQ